MRVNVYSQELSGKVDLVTKEGSDGKLYSAIQYSLHSSDMLHVDDQSAVTFWLPRSPERREMLAKTFENMAQIIRGAPPEV